MLTLDELRQDILFRFEYKDGELYRQNSKYKKKIGHKVGKIDKEGYVVTFSNGKKYFVHRLIFLMHHGSLPERLDHIDGNRSNNKIENLRKADKYENQYNRKLAKNNTTGVKGVTWRKKEKRFLAICHVSGKRFELGYFKILEDAKKAVEEFREKHHGEFARHN